MPQEKHPTALIPTQDIIIGDSFVRISGQRFPLVFVHGFTTTSEFWKEQADEFAKSYRVIRINLPGHGASPAPTARSYRIEDFCPGRWARLSGTQRRHSRLDRTIDGRDHRSGVRDQVSAAGEVAHRCFGRALDVNCAGVAARLDERNDLLLMAMALLCSPSRASTCCRSTSHRPARSCLCGQAVRASHRSWLHGYDGPSALVRHAKHTVQLMGAHTLLAGTQQMDSEEPLVNGNMRPLHDGASAASELLAATVALEVTGLRLPAIRVTSTDSRCGGPHHRPNGKRPLTVHS
jgi:pimeloyl-ACP methyl ester carboxylesterase